MKIIERNLPEFGLKLVWNGGKEVGVCDGDKTLYSLPLRTAGPRTALEAMRDEEAVMHEAAQG